MVVAAASCGLGALECVVAASATLAIDVARVDAPINAVTARARLCMMNSHFVSDIPLLATRYVGIREGET